MRRRSVIRDTIQMTVIQFFLECLALLFNAWMTRRVGAATVGTLALAGSFFNLAAMVAGGNAMLCASRFVSEELGKSCGCPAQILRNAVRFCLLLSVPVSAGIFAFAEPLSRQFLQSTAMAQAVRLMALLLPLGSISACLKGYFNAVCRVTVTAGCDVAEFLLRAGLLTGFCCGIVPQSRNRSAPIWWAVWRQGRCFPRRCCCFCMCGNGSHAVENAAFPLERTFAWQCRWRLAVV